MRLVATAALLALAIPALARLASQPAVARPIPLEPGTPMTVTGGRPLWLDYRGRKALKLAPLEGQERATDIEISALLTATDFQDGTIEVDVAGARRSGYSTSEDSIGYKGFIGVSFRVEGERAERIYIRPENGRAGNQLFRNRATQYEAPPEFTWQRLREEAPGKYESYVDLEAGAWTGLRIDVAGTTARLYVNGAPQPSLVVTDLRHGVSRGRIALWTRVSSEAYFSNLRVTQR